MKHATLFNAVMDAPFGKVGIRVQDDALREIVYLPESIPNVTPDTPLARAAVEQIEQYFANAATKFTLPLAPVGTAFQQRVWQAIDGIAPGVVLTYGQLAKQLGSAPRAIGQACGANYFPILIPCHRVVGAGGIGGFSNHAGDGFFRNVKRWLLTHEGASYP